MKHVLLPASAKAVGLALLTAAVTSTAGPIGCVVAEPSPDLRRSAPEPDVGQVSSAFGRPILVNGQRLVISDLGTIDGFTQNIAACGNGSLYSVRWDGVTRSTWLKSTRDDASPWTSLPGTVAGNRIGCDHNVLFSLNSVGGLFGYQLFTDGHFVGSLPGSYNQGGGSVPPGVIDIQSGLGNLYLLAAGATPGTTALYVSPQNDGHHITEQGYITTWQLLAGNLGLAHATGAGSATLTSPPPNISGPPRNRAYGLNPNSSLYYNDTILLGQNAWTSFPNGGVTPVSISADAPNVLYVAGFSGSLIEHLYKFTFSEASCSDGLDNDANGRTDGADPACRQPLADAYCKINTGDFCFDRISSFFTDALVHCPGAGQTAVIHPGACSIGAFGSDYQLERASAEPADMGRYCNTIAPDGTWGFSAGGSGSTPCQGLPAGSKIVHAGLYSTTGMNDVLARCTNGGTVSPVVGTAGVQSLIATLGHTNNQCNITVSPRVMPVFTAPIPTTAWGTGSGERGYSFQHEFDHAPNAPDVASSPCGATSCEIPLPQFMNGDFGTAHQLSNHGKWDFFTDESIGYDYHVDEGTPVRSLGNGKVLHGGSRIRDIASSIRYGSPYQNEIYVRYDVGTDPTYRETFIAYYGSLSERLVGDDETVYPGQILGYAGQNGKSNFPESIPRVEFILYRASNTNAFLPGTPDLGYHPPFVVDKTAPDYNPATGLVDTGSIGAADPYGWRAPAGMDPLGYYWARASTGKGSPAWQGMGAWSPSVWPADQAPPFPR